MNIYLIKNTLSHTKEIAFVLYFWGFTLLRPILQYYSDYSTYILFVYSLLLLLLSLKGITRTPQYFGSYIFIYCVLLILLIDLLFRPNNFTVKYIYEFVVFGLIPIFMISQVKDYEMLLRIFSLVSFFVFIIYFIDPLNDYRVFGDYMTFGFMLALPAYFGLYIGRKFFKYRWLVPFEIICLVEILIFSNRSAILSVIIFWVLIQFVYLKGTVKKLMKLFILSLLIILFIISFEHLMNFIVSLLNNYGVYSYSITKLNIFMSGYSLENFFSGRLEIWAIAKDLIDNNFLFGHGTGAFEAKYGRYTHNICLDLLIQYGFMGFLAMLILITKSSINIFKYDEGSIKLLGITLLCLWFPKLLFSTYFIKEIAIWCFITLGFFHKRKKRLILYS